MRKCVLGPHEPGKIKIPKCKKEGCGGLVKPDIVFFGEALPRRFTGHIFDVAEADLLIIIGTSLTVHPFATLASIVQPKTPRVLINLERVGDLGSKQEDVVLIGECDQIIKELCKELGWDEELKRAWAETKMEEVEKEKVEKVESNIKTHDRQEDGRDAKKNWLEEEVGKLAEAIGKRMDLQDKNSGKTQPGSNAEADAAVPDPGAPATVPLEPGDLSSSEVQGQRTKDQKDNRAAKDRNINQDVPPGYF